MSRKLPFSRLAALFIFFALLFGGMVCLRAQDIPNPGFEEWSGGNPVGWNTVNQNILGIDIITVTKDVTNPHGGTASAKLESILKSIPFVGQITAPGMLSLGKIIIDINNMTGSVEGGIPVSGKPIALHGWYRYTPAAGDSCIIGIGLSQWNGAGRDTLAMTYKLIGDNVAAWTEFNLPVEYLMTGQPDSMNIMFFSSNLLAGQLVAGSKMWVDDLWLEYSTVSVNNPGFDRQFSLCPMGDSHRLEVRLPGGVSGLLQVVSLNGSVVWQRRIGAAEATAQVDIGRLAPAMYLMRFVSDGGIQHSQKFIRH